MSLTLQLPFFLTHFLVGKIGKRGSNFWACGEEAVGQTRFGRWFWRSVFVRFGSPKKNINKEIRKKGDQTKHEDKIDCLQGANPVLPQGEGPSRGNSRDFFSAHFWSCSRFSRNKTFMSLTLQLPFFLELFLVGKIGKRGSNFWACGEEAVGQTRFGRWFWRSVFVRFGSQKKHK